MQLSKVTSWGFILGGILGILGFLVIGIALGLMEDDIAVADELKAFQDNKEIVVVIMLLFVGIFTYMAKSILQLAQAVKVPDEWYTYMRMLVGVMLTTLFVSMGLWMGISDETTVAGYEITQQAGNAVDSIQIVAGSFILIILSVFALKNGAGNGIFRVLIAILGVLSILDIVGLFVNMEDGLGFITWILWAVVVAGIGVLGLVTKDA
tara:strand:+ start:128 stop:751 length:624 start_codon:yes stop_codon:yes gene_type:complete